MSACWSARKMGWYWCAVGPERVTEAEALADASHEPGVRLMGNLRADEVAYLAEYAMVSSLKPKPAQMPSEAASPAHIDADEKAVRAAWYAWLEAFGRCWCGSAREGTAGWACKHVECDPGLDTLGDRRPADSSCAGPPRLSSMEARVMAVDLDGCTVRFYIDGASEGHMREWARLLGQVTRITATAAPFTSDGSATNKESKDR